MKKIEKSINFYEKLTNTKAQYSERNRWVSFPCEISLYHLNFDRKKVISKEFDHSNYNQEYINYIMTESTIASKNIVFNFSTDDLISERERIIKLNISVVSTLMYVNISMPYWFFIVEDPDGNEIEISGPVR